MNQEPVSVIINVFNEADTIEKEIREIHEKIVAKLPGSELIVAEDGSKDGTKEIIQRLVKELGIIHSTSTERKGYTKALRDALVMTRNPWVFFSDTGGKNDFDDFWKLYEVREGCDLVLGNRAGRTDQIYRRILTWGYNMALRLYFAVPTRDADAGFRIYRGDAIRAIARQDWTNKELISSELVIRIHYLGGKIREVPITYRQRKGVSRGLPPKKIFKVIKGVLSNFRRLKQECVKTAKL